MTESNPLVIKELIGCKEERVSERGKRKSAKKHRPYLAASTGYTPGCGVHKAAHKILFPFEQTARVGEE